MHDTHHIVGKRHWGRSKLYSHINFSRGHSWPGPDPSGFGRTGVIHPAVNATFPPSLQFWLKGFLSSTDEGCVVSHGEDLPKGHFNSWLSLLQFSDWQKPSPLCPHLLVLCNGAQSFRADVYISKQDACISPSPSPLYVGRNIPFSVGFQKHFVSAYLCVQIENKECPKERRVMPVTLTSRIYICPSHTSPSWTH